MQKLISERFIPIKIHIKERPEDFQRFKADWTPTLIIAEPDGTERYRFSGFLPADDFLAQLVFVLLRHGQAHHVAVVQALLNLR